MYANGWRHSFKCRRDLAINTATRNGFHFVGKLGGNAEPLYSVSDITTQQLLRSTLDGRSVAAVAIISPESRFTWIWFWVIGTRTTHRYEENSYHAPPCPRGTDYCTSIYLLILVNLFVYYICTILRFFISWFGSSWNKKCLVTILLYKNLQASLKLFY